MPVRQSLASGVKDKSLRETLALPCLCAWNFKESGQYERDDGNGGGFNDPARNR
jgi:hypothetical protein